uniref:Uncharacterized protein n=1 Tax=Physcomitrium patens TaxID=3218 RepID=A0A7I4B4J5_PHYPA
MILLLASFCVNLLSTVTRPWRRLFWLALHLYISVWSVVLNRVSEAFSRSVEIVTAYRREKELVVQLYSMRREYEVVKLRNSELQTKLDAFTRDRRRIMETLDLVTAEKKKAVETVKFLKNKDLETSNQQLTEIEEMLRRGLEETLSKLKVASNRNSEVFFNGLGADFQSIQAKDIASKTLLDKDTYKEKESYCDLQPLRTRPPNSTQIGQADLEIPHVIESEYGAAFTSTMFSALLSTLVAMVAGEAKDPCQPLVIALFSVVGMSLISVVRFFTKLQSQRGFLAVALLSLNWFVVGTLAHPAMPHVGHMGFNFFLAIGGRLLKLTGFENITRVVKSADHTAVIEL